NNWLFSRSFSIESMTRTPRVPMTNPDVVAIGNPSAAISSAPAGMTAKTPSASFCDSSTTVLASQTGSCARAVDTVIAATAARVTILFILTSVKADAHPGLPGCRQDRGLHEFEQIDIISVTILKIRPPNGTDRRPPCLRPHRGFRKHRKG